MPSLPVWLIVLTIALVTFGVYAPALRYEFVYDDYAQIVETTQLSSPAMIPRYFTGHVWAWKNPGSSGPLYRPVFLLWLLANQMAFGLAAPWWHLTSILTHVAATVLVYFVCRRVSGDPAIGAIAALIFGLHPAHLESVAWVSAIPDPLVTVLLLGSLLCFFAERRWWLWSYVLFAAALLTKEMALVYPALVFAVTTRGHRIRVVPYLLIVLVYLGIRRAALHAFLIAATPIPLATMVQTWPSLLLFYLRHLLWPAQLSVFYSLPLVTARTPQNFWIPAAIIAVAAAGLGWWAWRSRTAAFAACLLILPILPVLNLRTFGRTDTAHDRYLYLSVMGLGLLVALAIRRLRRPPVEWALVLALSSSLAYGTVRQQPYWSDNLSLFLRGAEVAPDNEVANQCLGASLMMLGKFTEALPYFLRALQSDPDMPQSLYSAGRSYYELGEYAQATAYLERAVAATQTKYVFAPAYLYLGLSQWKSGDADAGERTLRQAIQIKGGDDFRGFHLALGQVLEAKGDFPSAIAQFQAEIQENPDPAQARQAIERITSAHPR